MKTDKKYTAEEYVALINSALTDAIKRSDDERINAVADAMIYSVKNGGKRVRPMLLLEFCRVCGGDTAAALPLACAIEMIHSYSLIHDDLPCMDDDDFRRGKPSCHKQFGEATALLAGDGLLTLAFETLTAAPLPAEVLIKCTRLFAACAGYNGMIGGQTIDLQNEGKKVTVDDLKKMDALKTGELFRCSCVAGCIAAGAGDKEIAAATNYAAAIGLSFQIVDDLLDITSTTEELGKPVGSDEENEKSTYPALLGLEESKNAVYQLTHDAIAALSIFGESTEFLCDFAVKLAKRRN